MLELGSGPLKSIRHQYQNLCSLKEICEENVEDEDRTFIPLNISNYNIPTTKCK